MDAAIVRTVSAEIITPNTLVCPVQMPEPATVECKISLQEINAQKVLVLVQ
jgi:hypothetical protein